MRYDGVRLYDNDGEEKLFRGGTYADTPRMARYRQAVEEYRADDDFDLWRIAKQSLACDARRRGRR